MEEVIETVEIPYSESYECYSITIISSDTELNDFHQPLKEKSAKKTKINLKFLYDLEAEGKRSVIDWCINNGLITNRYECPKCNGAMALNKRPNTSDGYAWVCHKRTKDNPHDLSRSVRSGSIFSESKLTLTDILKIIYLWLNKCSNEFIMNETRRERYPISEWKKLCRETCVKLCLQESTKLGGVNKTVELDGGQFSNEKYNKRIKLDGNWVFAGVERGSNQFFIVIVDQNNSETLLEVIRDYIEPGTTIISSLWPNYNCLNDDDFRYLSIINSLKYEQSSMNVYIWNSIKAHLKRTKHIKGQFDSYICEHLWRRAHNKDADMFLSFLHAASTIYAPKTKD